jgi:hypothetical protein
VAAEEIKKVRVPKSTLPTNGYMPILGALVSTVSGQIIVTYQTAAKHKLIPGSKTDIFGLKPDYFNTSLNTTAVVATVTDDTFTIFRSNLPEDSPLPPDTPKPVIGETTTPNIIGFATVPFALNYLVRYRIVNEDKNLYSHWSPIYNIANEYEDDVTSSIDGGAEGGVD